MASVSFDAVGKVYDDGTRALHGLDLEVADGEFMVFVGPSGCGKTTALRMVAGLEDVTEGELRIGDRVVNELEPRERDVAMVFQNYALYPHMTVRDNIAFGLRMRGIPKAERGRRAGEIAAVLGLDEVLERRPGQLSGGQRQRVAMGRAIVRDPQVFLMDEPLSNLDARLRVEMRAEVARIQAEVGATTIYVTHDQVEAMTMGTRVCVFRRGVLQQVDAPAALFERPVNLFVASFIGSPAMNLLQGQLERGPAGLRFRIDGQLLPCPQDPALERWVGRTLALGIRPDHLTRPAADDEPGLTGLVAATELLGSELLVHLQVEGAPVVTPELLEVSADVDESVAATARENAARRRAAVVGRLDAAVRPQVGAALRLAVDPATCHLFDVASGRAI